MKRKLHMIFFEGEEGGGFGGGADSGHESAVTESSPEPSQQAPPTQAPLVDAAELAKHFGSTLGEHFKRQEAPAAKRTFTPEEIKQAQKDLGFWEPDDSFIQEFGNLETQKQAFMKLRDGMTNQLVNIMQAKLNDVTRDFETRLSPMQTMIQERQAAEQKSRFATAYPPLSNPKIQPMLEAVGSSLAKAGKFNGLTEAQAFDVLAKGVEEVIKVNNPEFKLDSPQPNNGRQGNSISHTSSGSGGGGGNAPSTAGKPAAVGILGSVGVKKR